MEVRITTRDPDAVDPTLIAETLAAAGFYVHSVIVNDGERAWTESQADSEPHTTQQDRDEASIGLGEVDGGGA